MIEMSTIKANKKMGKKIKDALMTQKKLAKITGINEVRLSRGINGEVSFTHEEVLNLEVALNIRLYTE